MQSNNKVQGK